MKKNIVTFNILTLSALIAFNLHASPVNTDNQNSASANALTEPTSNNACPIAPIGEQALTLGCADDPLPIS